MLKIPNMSGRNELSKTVESGSMCEDSEETTSITEIPHL